MKFIYKAFLIFSLLTVVYSDVDAQFLKYLFSPTKGTVRQRAYNGFFKWIYSNIGQEYGFALGSTNFLGDLGGGSGIGRSLFFDYKVDRTRYVGTAFFRINFTPYFASRFDLSYARVSGTDAKIKATSIDQGGFYRAYRNLSFRSPIVELAFITEYNFMRFEFGRKKYRQSPYIFGGIALFYFNPQAEHNNIWVNLQPLGTEGQGMAAYPGKEKYARFQPSIPLGIGYKYNYNRQISIAFEYGHRITFTDYIDDVSTTYVNPTAVYNEYEPLAAQQILQLSSKSNLRTDLDPDGSYSYITAPGQQRGDPLSKDSYMFTGVIRISYMFAAGRQHTAKF